MLVSLTVGKVDAGVTVLLTPDKRLIEFPSILLPPDISSGSIVDITVGRNAASEQAADRAFETLQDQIYAAFGAAEPATPSLRCRNATQTSVVLEWDPIQLATADLVSLSLFRNGQKAGNIPRPLHMHSTKISGLAVDTEYTFHLVLRTSAGTSSSERVAVRTHKMTDLSGITITTGILPAPVRETLARSVERIGAKIVDGVRIDTTHFVTTEGRGIQWEKAVEMNIAVVRPEWVEACEKNGRILGVTKFYLDALRPGPTSEEVLPNGAASPKPQSQPQPAPQKDLPPAPAAENGTGSGSTEERGPEGEGAGQRKEEAVNGDEESSEEDEEEEDDDDDDEEEEEEAEEKARSTMQDEQKVRLEDKQEQKVAIRPGQQAINAKGKELEGEDETKADSLDEKTATPGDGASFTEVAL